MEKTKTLRAFMKITHTNDIIDLGEFKDIDKKDVKKFLDKAIKIIITEDNKTINKYEDILCKCEDMMIEELMNRQKEKPASKIAGFGVE